MWILGIAGSHNGAVALIRDGEVVAAVQAERLSRFKRHLVRVHRMGSDVRQLARYCLEQAGIEASAIDCIATSTPWADASPRFQPEAALWSAGETPPVLTVPHHLAHAEYVLHYSPVERALVLVADGSGTLEEQRAQLDLKERRRNPIEHLHGIAKESISAYAFEDGKLELIYRFAGGASEHRVPGSERRLLHSVGHLWRWAAAYCCGDLNEAGKVMGLAPYGDARRMSSLRYLDFDDDSGALRVSFEQLADLARPNLAGIDVTGQDHYADLAAHLQAATNDLLLRVVRRLARIHPARDLCYTGGLALNGIANEHLIRAGTHRLHMNGSCEDNGTAIGAALAAYHHRTGRRVREPVTELYGRSYSAAEIDQALAARGILAPRLERRALIERTARALAEGRVVAWFQGRGEFGPRALGCRSILADPRHPEMRDILNLKVKRRERYRPYAPAVLEERASEFFDLEGSSPVMLRVVSVRVKTLPAITHVDGSARVQTVARSDNPTFYDLIKAFGELTGVPIVLNTSFNRAGQPIVESPADAVDAFINMKMDVLVLDDRLVVRGDLPRFELPAEDIDQRELEADDRLLVRHALRYRVWTAPDGDGEDVVRVYGLRGVAELDASAMPFVEALCRAEQFRAGDAIDWGHASGGYSWQDIRGALEYLLECGLLAQLANHTDGKW